MQDFRNTISKLILQNSNLATHCEIARWLIPQNITNNAVRPQIITRANGDPDLWRHMASFGHNAQWHPAPYILISIPFIDGMRVRWLYYYILFISMGPWRAGLLFLIDIVQHVLRSFVNARGRMCPLTCNTMTTMLVYRAFNTYLVQINVMGIPHIFFYGNIKIIKMIKFFTSLSFSRNTNLTHHNTIRAVVICLVTVNRYGSIWFIFSVMYVNISIHYDPDITSHWQCDIGVLKYVELV